MTDTNDAVDVSGIDRDKSHLIRADYDSVRIADAVRRSPHFTAAFANPGDYDVVFSTPDTGDGRAWSLTLEDPAPSDDDMLGQPVLHEALAAAILNHPDFVAATPDYPDDGDITIHTRDGRRYLGVIGIATDEDTALLQQPTPVAPSGDARHDVVHIAAALRSSPHIRSVTPVEPGDEAVWFKDAGGTEYELALVSSEPIPDAESVAYAWDAVAAAIGSHPHFIRSVLEQRSFGPLNLDTVTVDTRTGTEYTLKLTLKLPGDPRPEHDSRPASPAADLTAAADRLLHSDATDSERAMAGLLSHVAATWDNLDGPLREHAHAVARTLTR
ncbi:hypothetical protein LK08_22750 [Streptomyces sp. MUSC 125]|uniref:hypothetical protein n=1 Tax=Streptomyces sp. MUSC 125 TaxID=1428624 RepID=UPI00057DB18E|nr:hypothetical protein [Streptomyces sp. MUSC 125]KIE24712.1 hypothetical protein LK08_22750 [Streptomyces sp. MUSC 125]